MRIKQLREEYGYSQEGVANIVGMSQTTYSGWEKQPPESLSRLAALARHYDVSADYLLELTNDPTPADRRRQWDRLAVELANGLMELPEYRREEMARTVQYAVARRRAEERIELLRTMLEALIGAESVAMIWDRLGDGDADIASALRILNTALQNRDNQALQSINES